MSSSFIPHPVSRHGGTAPPPGLASRWAHRWASCAWHSAFASSYVAAYGSTDVTFRLVPPYRRISGAVQIERHSFVRNVPAGTYSLRWTW